MESALPKSPPSGRARSNDHVRGFCSGCSISPTRGRASFSPCDCSFRGRPRRRRGKAATGPCTGSSASESSPELQPPGAPPPPPPPLAGGSGHGGSASAAAIALWRSASDQSTSILIPNGHHDEDMTTRNNRRRNHCHMETCHLNASGHHSNPRTTEMIIANPWRNTHYEHLRAKRP